jgi:UDP-N-acetylmuramate dehydrogenase
MNIIKQLEEFKEKIDGQILFNENLSKYSWFNLGGPSKIIFKPKNLNELSTFLKVIKGFAKINVLGAGSNTLIRDGGFDGIIIKLGKSFSHTSLYDESTIIVGASALEKDLSNFACTNSISGFEFLSCIPGSVGGGIRMNSGCYGEDISKILLSVQTIDLNGQVKIIYSKDINFSYRGSNLTDDLIFISATFKGSLDTELNIKKKIDSLINKKKNDQPSKIKTCGSTFKNPINNKAWRLIKDSGCAGMEYGEAYISSKHCNFFVNKGKAKSSDLEKLINNVKSKVFAKTGINLELELKIIGEKL